MCKRKMVMDQEGVTENKRFIMLSAGISSSNGNRLSKLYSDTYSLKIQPFNLSYAIIDYPFDDDSILEINFTKHVTISTMF